MEVTRSVTAFIWTPEFLAPQNGGWGLWLKFQDDSSVLGQQWPTVPL